MDLRSIIITSHVLCKSIPDRCHELKKFSHDELEKILKRRLLKSSIVDKGSRLWGEISKNGEKSNGAFYTQDGKYVYVLRNGSGGWRLSSIYPIEKYNPVLKFSIAEYLEIKNFTNFY